MGAESGASQFLPGIGHGMDRTIWVGTSSNSRSGDLSLLFFALSHMVLWRGSGC